MEWQILAGERSMRSSIFPIPRSIPGLISRSRTAAISSAATALFHIPEGGFAAEIPRTLWRRCGFWRKRGSGDCADGNPFKLPTGKDNGSSLLELLWLLHGVEGIDRIRLGSLEPRVITEEFVKAAAGMEKLCPHFHLSLQSGLRRHPEADESSLYRRGIL